MDCLTESDLDPVEKLLKPVLQLYECPSTVSWNLKLRVLKVALEDGVLTKDEFFRAEWVLARLYGL